MSDWDNLTYGGIVPVVDTGNIATLPNMPAGQMPPIQGGVGQTYVPPVAAPPTDWSGLGNAAQGLAQSFIPAGIGQVQQAGGGPQYETAYNQTGYFTPQTGRNQHIVDTSGLQLEHDRLAQDTAEFGENIAQQLASDRRRFAGEQAAMKDNQALAQRPTPAQEEQLAAFRANQKAVPVFGGGSTISKMAADAIKPTHPVAGDTSVENTSTQNTPGGGLSLDDWYGQHKQSYNTPDPQPEFKPDLIPYGNTLDRGSDLGRRNINAPPAPPLPPPDPYAGMTSREMMEERYRNNMRNQDAQMNALQQRANSQSQYDGWRNFAANTLIPGIGGFFKNPYMGQALAKQSEGLNKQVAGHMANQQALMKLRDDQANKSFDQMKDYRQLDESERHNKAGEENTATAQKETGRHNQASEQEAKDKLAHQIENDKAEMEEKTRQHDREFAEKKEELQQKRDDGKLSRDKYNTQIAQYEQDRKDKIAKEEREYKEKVAEKRQKAAEFMLTYGQKNREITGKQDDKQRTEEEQVVYNPGTKQMERRFVPKGQLASEQAANAPKKPDPIGDFINGIVAKALGGGQPATAAARPPIPVPQDGIIRPPGVAPLPGRPAPPARAIQAFMSMPPEKKAEFAVQFQEKYGVLPPGM